MTFTTGKPIQGFFAFRVESPLHNVDSGLWRIERQLISDPPGGGGDDARNRPERSAGVW